MKTYLSIQKFSVLGLFSLMVGFSIAGHAQTYINYNEFDTLNGGSERHPGYDEHARSKLPKGLVYSEMGPKGRVEVDKNLKGTALREAIIVYEDWLLKHNKPEYEAYMYIQKTTRPTSGSVGSLIEDIRFLRDQVDSFKPVELNHILPGSPLSTAGKRKFLKDSFNKVIDDATNQLYVDKYDTTKAKRALALKWMPQFFQVVATKTAVTEAEGLLAYYKKEGIRSRYTTKVDVAGTLKSMNSEENFGFRKSSQKAALNTFIAKAGFKILSATMVLGLAGGVIAADAGASIATEETTAKQGSFAVNPTIPTENVARK